MKPSVLTLSLLLFAFTFAFSNGVPVFDDYGEPVVPGVAYYIDLPNNDNGGVVLGETGNSSCPVTVLEDEVDFDFLKFSIPTGENNSAIVTNHPLDIEFTKKPNCAESSKWMVYFDNEIQRHCVGIGGPEDHPGQQILNGTFRIRDSKKGYNFVFCLEQPAGGSSTCFIIGKYYPGYGVQSLLILLENQHKHDLLTFSITRANDSQRAIRTVV